MTFMVGQLLIGRPVIAIVVGKATIFHRGFEWDRVDYMKPTLLDFCFSVSKKQKIVAAEE